MSEPSTSMPVSSQSLQKPLSQKSSQGSSHNDSNDDDKNSGIGSLGLKESSAHPNNAISQNESEDTGQTGSAIFHALPFKDQVKYLLDYLRAGTENRAQPYPPMIKNKSDRHCFQRRADKYYQDKKNKVLLHRVLIKNIGKFMYSTIIFNMHAIFWAYHGMILVTAMHIYY